MGLTNSVLGSYYNNKLSFEYIRIPETVDNVQLEHLTYRYTVDTDIDIPSYTTIYNIPKLNKHTFEFQYDNQNKTIPFTLTIITNIDNNIVFDILLICDPLNIRKHRVSSKYTTIIQNDIVNLITETYQKIDEPMYESTIMENSKIQIVYNIKSMIEYGIQNKPNLSFDYTVNKHVSNYSGAFGHNEHIIFFTYAQDGQNFNPTKYQIILHTNLNNSHINQMDTVEHTGVSSSYRRSCYVVTEEHIFSAIDKIYHSLVTV